MTEIGSRQDLDEAVEAFKDNPNMHNQSVLERAMRVYQCNVTAMEPVEKICIWSPTGTLSADAEDILARAYPNREEWGDWIDPEEPQAIQD